MADASNDKTILAAGGGMAWIWAAAEAAEAGWRVVLVEREHWMGGRVTRMNKYFPERHRRYPAPGMQARRRLPVPFYQGK